MTPEDLVATRETSARLKAAGWTAETYFLWHAGHPFGSKMVPYLTSRPKPTSEYFLAWAPTLVEILEQLRKEELQVKIWAHSIGYTAVVFREVFQHANPAEAAALLWLRVNGKDATP